MTERLQVRIPPGRQRCS